jgi:hypothetical protein
MATSKKDIVPKTEAPKGEGWGKVQSAVRYYYIPETKDEKLNPCQGLLLATVRRYDDTGDQFVVRVTEPCMAKIQLDEDESEEVRVETGEILFVDERAQIASVLRAFSKTKKMAEVRIIPIRKRQLKNNRSLWLFEVFARPGS